MIRPYLAIIRAPYAARLMLSNVIYGLAAAGSLLPLVFFARDATGSFAGASGILAASAVGGAIGSPARGRVVDRHGARRTMPLFALALLVTTAGLVLAGREHAHLVVLVPLAFLVGLVAQTPGVVLRAIWPRITAGHERSTSFALLTVMHELTNLGGPLIGALLLVVTSPEPAFIAGTVVAAFAMVWFSRSPGVDGSERADPRALFSLGPLEGSGFRALLAIVFFYGVLFGALEDIALPAFAVEHGSRASAGILAAAIALGIAIGGFAYGLRRWTDVPGRLMPGLSAVAFLGIAPALLADSIAAMTLAMLIFGLLIAPVTTLQFAVIDDLVPSAFGAEAFGWFSSIALAGAAGGAILAGKLVDTSGAGAAVVAVVAAAGACVLVALAFRAPLATTVSPEPTSEQTAA